MMDEKEMMEKIHQKNKKFNPEIHIKIGKIREICDTLPEEIKKIDDECYIEKAYIRPGKIIFRGEGTSTIRPVMQIYIKNNIEVYNESRTDGRIYLQKRKV